MKSPDFFISIDWGTTNFRLRLVKTASLSILVERKTDQGVKQLWEAFSSAGNGNRKAFFLTYLAGELAALPGGYELAPIVISGMASSSIGMCDIDYGKVPFDETGRNLKWHSFTLGYGRLVILISGIRSQQDMMRGEETQAIGLASLLQPFGSGILLLPGTHSKHVFYTEGQFSDFTTYLTGELFALLTKHSLLRNSVVYGALGAAERNAFLEGVGAGSSSGIAAKLFTVRARDVLEGRSAIANYYYLSGVVIGAEVAHLRGREGPVFLAANAPFFILYQLALRQLLAEDRLHFIAESDLDAALLAGQRKILSLHG